MKKKIKVNFLCKNRNINFFVIVFNNKIKNVYSSTDKNFELEVEELDILLIINTEDNKKYNLTNCLILKEDFNKNNVTFLHSKFNINNELFTTSNVTKDIYYITDISDVSEYIVTNTDNSIKIKDNFIKDLQNVSENKDSVPYFLYFLIFILLIIIIIIFL